MDTKKCPMCAEEVKSEAQICRFCGYDFNSEVKKEKLREKISLIIGIPLAVVFCIFLIYRISEQNKEIEAQRPKLSILTNSCSVVPAKTHIVCNGTVKNISKESLPGTEVKMISFDPNLSDTGVPSNYISNMSLLPNDVSDFQSLRLYDPSLKTVSIYFKNLDGIIPSTGDSTFYTINP